MKRGDPVLVLFPEGVIGPEREPERGWYMKPGSGGSHFVAALEGSSGWWVPLARIVPDKTRKPKKKR
jgi:hypothetical protein